MGENMISKWLFVYWIQRFHWVLKELNGPQPHPSINPSIQLVDSVQRYHLLLGYGVNGPTSRNSVLNRKDRLDAKSMRRLREWEIQRLRRRKRRASEGRRRENIMVVHGWDQKEEPQVGIMCGKVMHSISVAPLAQNGTCVLEYPRPAWQQAGWEDDLGDPRTKRDQSLSFSFTPQQWPLL